MRPWKVFIPDHRDLERLLKISPRGLFVSGKNNPVMESIYLLDHEDNWISLSWSYVDVEFKFEIYCVSIDRRKETFPEDLTCIEDIQGFSSISFLLRSEWLRPAHPGEVPDHFEQVKEESGTASSVPSSATVVGTFLYGILLNDVRSKPFLAITVNDDERYSLKHIVATEEMADLISGCDLCTLSQLMTWKPPESVH